MERVSSNQVIVFTPNGFLKQGDHYIKINPWQRHRSGWSVKDFEKRGYKVYGVNGWKPLRGENAVPRIKPLFLGIIISEITQFFIIFFPTKAFQLFAVLKKN